MTKIIPRFWLNPITRGIDINAIESIKLHRKIIESNPFLLETYLRWYHEFKNTLLQTSNLLLPIVELGCGPSFLEQVIPAIIKTDIEPHPNCDRLADAEALPFADGSLRSIFMTGVLHHLKNPNHFFKECERCLPLGGMVVMIEPSNSFIHRVMTNLFNPHEYYDDALPSWDNRSVSGRMSQANNALPSIIFKRDRQKFERQFPKLKIQRIEHHTFLLWTFGGGLSYRPILPKALLTLAKRVESLAHPMRKWIGTMMTVELQRT